MWFVGCYATPRQRSTLAIRFSADRGYSHGATAGQFYSVMEDMQKFSPPFAIRSDSLLWPR